ncbi:MAG: carbon-nitrogen hydrolase family protein [Phascolarctobacterium sp.]|nr:carbon-nitrogen hydrolase family protein [Phascolarctobacterium sp.]
MKIALLHFDFCGGPQEKNTKKILCGMKMAKEAGARWIITPEMALQGYLMKISKNPYTIASEENGIFLPFQKACQELNVKLFLGCAENDGRFDRNSCTVIDENGRIIARHGKIKVVKWITENWAEPGDNLEPFLIDGINTGLLVCADSYYGIHGVIERKNGAELLIVICAWPPRGCGGPPEHAWIRLSTLAYDIPVLICNQTGNNGMNCLDAQSAVVVGDVLFTYEGDEAILYIDFDEVNKKVLSKSFAVQKVNF